MVSVETFRQIALSFKDATEEPHFDKTSFRLNKKIFATLDIKIGRACLMLSEIDQSVFSTYNKAIIYPVPNKWGKQGATFVELKLVPKAMLKDAMEQAYNKINTKKTTVKK